MAVPRLPPCPMQQPHRIAVVRPFRHAPSRHPAGQPYWSVYSYWQVNYTAGGNGFNIWVGMLSGDADVFVTSDGTVPSITNYGWASATDFNEYVFIADAACPLGTCTYNIATTPYMNKVRHRRCHTQSHTQSHAGAL